jgi:hypothetical protein
LITLTAFPIFNAVYFKKKHYERLMRIVHSPALLLLVYPLAMPSFDFHFGALRAATATATNSREVQQRMHAGMFLFT